MRTNFHFSFKNHNLELSKISKAYSPQTNGMCERFNKTMKQEFFDTAMRKKIYTDLDAFDRRYKIIVI